MTDQMWGLITLAGGMLLLLAAVSFLSQRYSLDQIKSKTVGDGQYGSARWATPGEIRKTYVQVPFRVSAWRRGIKRPTAQGLVVGSVGPPSAGKKQSFLKRGRIYALVDCDDVHLLMIGASGWEVLFYASTAALGIASLSFASVGYWLRNLYWWERLILLAGAITLITPGAITDAIGCGLLVVIYISQKMLTSGPVSKTAG